MGPGNRPLDLEWLEDFLALAETGNFSRAAESRAIAQPAFSRHIRAFEEWAGVDLVDRSAHPVELTAAGKKIHPLIQGVVSGLEAARIKARAAHDQAAASLRLASTHSLSVTFLPRWIGQIETRMRLGPIQTLSDHSQACEDLMLQRRVQFLLCYGHAAVPGRLDEGQFPMTLLGEDTLLPVCAPDHAGRPLFDPTAAAPLPLLDYSEHSGLGRILRASAAKRGLHEVSTVFTAHNAFLLKSFALAGRGLAWLPRSLIVDELQSGLLLIVGRPDWPLPMQIRLYRQGAEMTATAEQFWAAACSMSAPAVS